MATRKRVVILLGQAQVGKSTFAELLVARVPRSKAIAFADSIKAAVSLIFAIPMTVLNGTGAEKEAKVWCGGTKSARWLMRWLGTDVIRRNFPKLWLHRTCDDTLAALASGFDCVFITDGRLWVERSEPAQYIGDKAEVRTVLIHRSGVPQDPPPTRLRRLAKWLLSFVGVEVPMMHPTESEVYEMRVRTLAGEPLVDRVVVNDGTKEDLARKADELAAWLAEGSEARVVEGALA